MCFCWINSWKLFRYFVYQWFKSWVCCLLSLVLYKQKSLSKIELSSDATCSGLYPTCCSGLHDFSTQVKSLERCFRLKYDIYLLSTCTFICSLYKSTLTHHVLTPSNSSSWTWHFYWLQDRLSLVIWGNKCKVIKHLRNYGYRK